MEEGPMDIEETTQKMSQKKKKLNTKINKLTRLKTLPLT